MLRIRVEYSAKDKGYRIVLRIRIEYSAKNRGIE